MPVESAHRARFLVSAQINCSGMRMTSNPSIGGGGRLKSPRRHRSELRRASATSTAFNALLRPVAVRTVDVFGLLRMICWFPFLLLFARSAAAAAADSYREPPPLPR